MFGLWVFVTALVAGGVAAVSGFGIGSLLTPLLAVRYGTKLAVAIVSIPHLVGTTARFVGLRRQLDRRVFPELRHPERCRWPAGRVAERKSKQSQIGNGLWLLATVRRTFGPERPGRSNAFPTRRGMGRGSALRFFRRTGRESGRYPLRGPAWL